MFDFTYISEVILIDSSSEGEVSEIQLSDEELCKPEKCVQGKYLSKEQAQSEYEKHGAFGFSMIEFPAPERAIPNYCTLYPPTCREYWVSIPDTDCRFSD